MVRLMVFGSLLYPRKVVFRTFLIGLFLIANLAAASIGRATDVYIAQNATGAANGSSCAGAYGVSYLNTAGNWVAGNTYHLCGTFNYAVGANGITVLASGTATSPINIVFESGAILQSPAFGGCAQCGMGGAIVINNENYVVIDGKNTGIIQNTANGSSLQYQNGSIGIYAYGDHLTIRNLTIQNIYLASSTEPDSQPGFNSTDIQFNSGNMEICNNTINDAHVGIWFSTTWAGPRTEGPTGCNDTVSATGVHVYNNYVSDHGWQINAGGNGYVNIYGNEITNWSNWFYPTANPYHLDGIIAYGYSSGSPSVTKPYIYNNYIHGDFLNGSPTGFVFCTYGNTGSGSACTIYNNLLVGTGGTATCCQGIYFHSADGNPLGPHYVYNNTLSGFTTGSIYMDGDNTQVYTIENNIFLQNGGWYLQSGGWGSLTMNYNVGYGGRNPGGSGGPWNSMSFAAWNAQGYDVNSSDGVNPNLSSTYLIQNTSSVAYNRGTNLTAQNITTLDTSAGTTFGPGYACGGGGCVVRPATGAWNAGVYDYSTSTASNPPAPPTGLTATVE
jgi:hypothetical protein